MATIESYETKSGKRWRVRYRKPNRRQTDKRGFTTKRDAQLFAATIETDKAMGTYIDPTAGKVTLAHVHAQIKPTGKETSRKNREIAWRIRIEPTFGAREISSIKPTEIDAWIADLIDTGASRTVVGDVLAVLRDIFDAAVKDRLIYSSPVGRYVLPVRGQKPMVFLSHADVAQLARHSRYPAFVYVLTYCGLRWGEAAALRVMDVDTDRMILHVRRAYAEVGSKLILGPPKGGKPRDVPLPDFIAPMLAIERGKDDLVFTTSAGLPLRNSSARKDRGWFTGATRRSGLVLTPHDLRHTAASLAVQAGANVKVLQRMLGHESAAVTLDTYSVLFDDDLHDVSRKLSLARSESLESVGKLWAEHGSTPNHAHKKNPSPEQPA